jgi:hypothetical protein
MVQAKAKNGKRQRSQIVQTSVRDINLYNSPYTATRDEAHPIIISQG